MVVFPVIVSHQGGLSTYRAIWNTPGYKLYLSSFVCRCSKRDYYISLISHYLLLVEVYLEVHMLDKNRMIKINLMIRSNIKETKKIKIEESEFDNSILSMIEHIAEEYGNEDYNINIRHRAAGYLITISDADGVGGCEENISPTLIERYMTYPTERFRRIIRETIENMIESYRG